VGDLGLKFFVCDQRCNWHNYR